MRILRVVERVAPRVRPVTRVDIAIDAYLKNRTQFESIRAIIEDRLGRDCTAEAIRWGASHPVEIAAEFSERIGHELDWYRVGLRRETRFLDMTIVLRGESCRAGFRRRLSRRRRDLETDIEKLHYVEIWATMLAADHSGESHAMAILEELLNALLEQRSVSEIFCHVLRNRKGTPNPFNTK